MGTKEKSIPINGRGILRRNFQNLGWDEKEVLKLRVG